MNKLIPLLGFGVGLLVLGLFWHLYNDVFEMALLPYVLTNYTAWGVSYTHDKYYDFMYMVWRLLPWFCMGIGILLLFAAGASASGDSSSEATP